MTTIEKLDYLKNKTGRNWGNIAELIGVSRQMMDMVRKGERRFSDQIESKLDNELLKITTPDPYSQEMMVDGYRQSYKILASIPEGKRYLGWISTALLEATASVEAFRSGDQQTGQAKAYRAQTVFSHIFRDAEKTGP